MCHGGARTARAARPAARMRAARCSRPRGGRRAAGGRPPARCRRRTAPAAAVPARRRSVPGPSPRRARGGPPPARLPPRGRARTTPAGRSRPWQPWSPPPRPVPAARWDRSPRSGRVPAGGRAPSRCPAAGWARGEDSGLEALDARERRQWAGRAACGGGGAAPGARVGRAVWDTGACVGAWRSLVARTVRVGEVPSSNLTLDRNLQNRGFLVSVQWVGGHGSVSSNMGMWTGLRRKRSMMLAARRLSRCFCVWTRRSRR